MTTDELKAIFAKMGKPILDLDTFSEFYQHVKDFVRETFEREKRVLHYFIAIKPDGWPEVTSFDRFIDLGIAFGDDENGAKDRIYGVFAHGIKRIGVIGFVDFFEAWTVSGNIEEGDTPERAHERYLEEVKRYGQIRDIPTRREVVMLNARFKETAYLTEWEIGRRDEEAWLMNFQEFKEKDPHDGERGRQGILHKAVVENMKGNPVR